VSAIELHARRTPEYAARLAHALAVLQTAAAAHAGRIVQATSLGAEDMVITDLIARHRLPIAIGTLQTGLLHAETLALIRRTEAHYGLGIEVVEPNPESVLHFVATHGERAMFDSVALRKHCCAIRKVEPLARLLSRRSAWVTGMRREQSSGRSGVAFDALDDAGRTKFNPLADWTSADVWHHIASFDVPYNPLHDRFYPSIGCAPCTRAVAVGEDSRAGRWWWEEEEGAKECGLHVSAHAGNASATPTSIPTASGAHA
jgi:phosphoadenosine phosphosulfate reductase